jgi:hypothetical protein
VASSIRHRVLALWNGQLPLARVFWLYAILYGTLANLFATALSFASLAAGLPALLAAALHLLPLPYNIAAGVGVWRSADRYPGLPAWAVLARICVVVWAVLATLA